MKKNNIKHINKSLIQRRGFTLIDVMVSIAIIGVLASIAIPSYRQYILKARAVEILVFMEEVKKEFHLNYDGEFPFEVKGSKSRKMSQFKKTKPRVTAKEMIISPSAKSIDKYWYDADPRNKNNYATFVYNLNKDLFPECGSGKYCAIHHIIKRSSESGALIEICGRWNKNKKWGRFPLSELPKNCRTECVRCEMKKIK